MSMSRDRVEFKLAQANNNRKIPLEKMIGLCTETLGLTVDEARTALTNGVTVRCRPSQFARFIIRRMEVGAKVPGFTNGLREMEPCLIQPERFTQFIDVSKRPAARDDE